MASAKLVVVLGSLSLVSAAFVQPYQVPAQLATKPASLDAVSCSDCEFFVGVSCQTLQNLRS
jgi:hypothetical protein